MIQEIYVNYAERTYRQKPKLNKASCPVVFFETVEDFSKEDELNYIEVLTKKIRESGKSVSELNLLPVADILLDIIGLDRTVESLELALAWVRDTLDARVDEAGFEYARLPHCAKANPKVFRRFQTAMNNNKVACIGLQDLSNR